MTLAMTSGSELCALCTQPIGDRPAKRNRSQTQVAHLDCLARRRNGKEVADLQRIREKYLARLATAVVDVPKWPWARLETVEFERSVPDRRLRAVAEKWTTDRGSMLLLGPSGAGKTTVCVALVNRFHTELSRVDRPKHQCRVNRRIDGGESYEDIFELGILERFVWITGHSLAFARRNAALGSEPELVTRCRNATLLVVDEVGVEPLADSILFEVVNERYARQTPTIVTSGYSRQDFCGRYGDALFRRLTQSGALMDVWPKPKPELREVARG